MRGEDRRGIGDRQSLDRSHAEQDGKAIIIADALERTVGFVECTSGVGVLSNGLLQVPLLYDCPGNLSALIRPIKALATVRARYEVR